MENSNYTQNFTKGSVLKDLSIKWTQHISSIWTWTTHLHVTTEVHHAHGTYITEEPDILWKSWPRRLPTQLSQVVDCTRVMIYIWTVWPGVLGRCYICTSVKNGQQPPVANDAPPPFNAALPETQDSFLIFDNDNV